MQDFLKISDPRLARSEIAHAHIRDKIPLLGIEPETLALSAQTLKRLTQWSRAWIFIAPERWLNFLARFRQEEISSV